MASLLSSGALLGGSRLVQDRWLHLSLNLMAGVVLAASALLGGSALGRRLSRRATRALAADLLGDDPTPSLLADRAGRVLAQNPAARAAFGSVATLADLLAPHVADAGGVASRLAADLHRAGAAKLDLPTRLGTLHLSARRLSGGICVWRAQGMEEGEHDLPVLDLDPAGRALSANAAARRLLGPALDAAVLDQPLHPGNVARFATASGPADRLVVGLPAGPDLRRLLLLPPDAAAGDPRSAPPDWDAIEALPLPLLRLSPDGVVISANPPACALLARPVGPGTRLSDLLEGPGRPLGEWIADVAAGRPAAGPQFLRGTGSHQDATLRMSLSAAGGPDDRHLIALLDDVTELKAIEAQFVQSQKMQALGQLAGGVAHDFNNLLSAITGHCDLLLLHRDQTDPDYADLSQIQQNVNRAAALVGQLLAFSRKQSMIPETLDLRVALSELTHLLNRLVGERVRLTFDHDPDLGFVRADKRQLEQVIMNLVVNARDAMPAGGDIRIVTGNCHLEEPRVLGRATVPPGRYVLVRVEDLGTGIPPERLPKIFEPFYTTKKPGEGTGLGLSTVYGIVKQSGGYVFVDSEVGKGSAFTLWFPAHDRPSATSVAARRLASAGDRSPGAILLVEDEAPVRSFAARALRLRGHSVLEADSAQAALDLLADLSTTVDLILSDVILPDLDGPTWVREALVLRPGMRVIFVSGYAEESFAEHKALIPGSAFLPKPFSLSDLTSLVERQLAGEGEA